MTDTALTVNVNATEVAVSPATTLVVGVADGGSTILETSHALEIVSQAVLTIDLGAPGVPGSGDPAGTAAALIAEHEAAADPHPGYMLEASFTWANLGGKPATFGGLGVSLVAGDVPALDWSKITTGKPTTLGGYGITDAAPATHVGSGGAAHALATAAADGFMSAAGFAKLAGISAGATANATDAQLRDRSTHTGTQLAATISDLAASVRAVLLTGLSTASSTAIAATDGILDALGKLQAQITSAASNLAANVRAVVLTGLNTTAGQGVVIATDSVLSAIGKLQSQISAGGSGAVSSVFGRSGAVVAAANDYSFAQIGAKPTTLTGYGITDGMNKTDAQATSLVISRGASAGFYWEHRDDSTKQDMWYTSGGTAYLWRNGVGNLFGVDATRVYAIGREVVTTSANAYRMVQGNYGAFLRQDGSSLYVLLTASGDQYGGWNSLRPLSVALSTGRVAIGHGLDVTGPLTVAGASSLTGSLNTTGEVVSGGGVRVTNASSAGDGAALTIESTGKTGAAIAQYKWWNLNSPTYTAGLTLYAYPASGGLQRRVLIGDNGDSYIYDTAGNVQVAWSNSDNYHREQVNGGILSYGAQAQVEIRDRTTNRAWTFYGSADVFRLYNGNADTHFFGYGGAFGAGTQVDSDLYGAFNGRIRIKGAVGTAGIWYDDTVGNRKFFCGVVDDSNWGVYNTTSGWTHRFGTDGRTTVLDAAGGGVTTQPRVFRGATDPGTKATTDDVWIG